MSDVKQNQFLGSLYMLISSKVDVVGVSLLYSTSTVAGSILKNFLRSNAPPVIRQMQIAVSIFFIKIPKQVNIDIYGISLVPVLFYLFYII